MFGVILKVICFRFFKNKERLCLLMCPQHGIKHTEAVPVCIQNLLLLIAALCFIPCCGHFKNYSLKNETDTLCKNKVMHQNVKCGISEDGGCAPIGL